MIPGLPSGVFFIPPGQLGERIELIASSPLADRNRKAKDKLSDDDEYFLGKFAAAGKLRGEFLTPTCVVQLLHSLSFQISLQ